MDNEYPAIACPNCGYTWKKFYLPGEDYNMKKPKLTGFIQNAVVRLKEEYWLCTICGRKWNDVGGIRCSGDSKIVKMKDVGGFDPDTGKFSPVDQDYIQSQSKVKQNERISNNA